MKNYPKLIKTEYFNSNNAVIEANICDYGAKGDGVTDDTAAFKSALDYMKVKGGILYAPKGIYKLTQEMIIPEGVTLLGDFKEPNIEDAKVGGTVLALYPQTVAQGNNVPFFNVKNAASLNGLTFWYPEQNLDAGIPIEYPYTVQTETLPSVLTNLHFVNSYCAICQEVDNDYTIQQMIRNVYGTPLFCGFWFDRAPDICRQYSIDYRPDWWLGSGLPSIPDEKVLKNWLYENAVAFDLGRIDWHYVADITVRGYKIGVKIHSGFGKAFNLDIADCKTCFQVDNISYYGLQMTNCNLHASGSDEAVAMRILANNEENGTSINSCVISSTGHCAIEVDKLAIVSVQDSRISAKTGIIVSSGKFKAVNTVIESEILVKSKELKVCEFVNCYRKSGDPITAEEASCYTAVYDEANKNEVLDKEELNKRNALCKGKYKKTEKNVLILAENYGVCDGGTDVGPNLQEAIDAAYNSGGGIVYIPAGEYRINSPVTIRKGVELRGTTEFFHYVIGKTAYFITDYGKGDENMQALFTLEEKAGLCGISVSYSEVRQATIGEYAATVRCLGSDTHIIGVTVTGAWWVVDMLSCRCDRHYIESLNFCSFKKGITVGNGCVDGVIVNAHSNPGEIWDNPYTDRQSWISAWNGPLQRYMFKNSIGYYIGECKNETVYMSFIFASLRGVHIDDGAEGLYVIGQGVDFSSVDFYLTGKNDAVIVDAQLVGTWDSGEYNSTAVAATESFVGSLKLYNACIWNIHDNSIRIKNGRVCVNGGVFFQCGDYAALTEKGIAVLSGANFLRKNKGVFALLGSETELCAFGNTFTDIESVINDKATIKGSDLVDYL